jgi:hypothetical protein
MRKWEAYGIKQYPGEKAAYFCQSVGKSFSHHQRHAEYTESMNQWRNTAQASRHEHQCSEEAILCALELRMHCHKDCQRPENSYLSNKERTVLDSNTRSETRKIMTLHETVQVESN